MLNKLKITILLLMFCGTIYAQQTTGSQNNMQTPDSLPAMQTKQKPVTSKLTYKIIEAPNKTYCYDIYSDGKLMIHQPNIPAVPGNEGFKTKVDAMKVANLVIKKIKNGEMPPTVSVKELKKMQVVK